MPAFVMRLGRVLLVMLVVIVAAVIGCSQMRSDSRSGGAAKMINGPEDIAMLPPDQAQLMKEGGWNQPIAAPAPPGTPPMAGEGNIASASTGSNFDSQYRAPSRDQLATKSTEGVPAGSPGHSAPSSDARSLAGFPDINRWFLPAAYAADNQVSEKYLIRSGNLSVKLDDLDVGQKKAEQIAAKYGGTITESNISKDNSGYRSGSITLRVPADKFQAVWNELMSVGEVINQQTSTQDVGGDYVSSVSHLKALAAEQVTLQKMFDEALAVQRSRGLGEAYQVLLDTEQRLKEVSEEIQGTEDHVKQLADQITRSTITLSLTENPKLPSASPPDKFNWGLGETFNNSVRMLMENSRHLMQGLIYFIVTLQWVWWLLLFFAARWGWKQYKKLAAAEKVAKPAPTAGPADK